MEAILVPISMFAAIALIASLWLYYRYRNRSAVQQTVRTAMEKGHELTPELLDRLGQQRASGHADLRRGVIGIGLGLAFAIFAFALGEEDAMRPLLGVSAFPFVIGVAYLALWRFAGDKDA